MVVKLNVMFMILLWAGFLPLISSHRRPSWTKAPVCEAYNLPENTRWIARISCDEHKRFRCAVDHVAKVETVCKNGKWIEELACSEVQCPVGERFSNTDEESPLGILIQTYNLNCSIGATSIGSSLTVQCSAVGNKGRWVVIQNCELVLCPSTEGIINFESPVPDGFPFGKFESKKCASGYQRNGDKGSVNCTVDGRNGKWTIVKDCAPVQCPARQSRYTTGTFIPDGIYEDGYKLQCSSAEFRYGYLPVKCLADGTWFEPSICVDCFERRQRFDFNYEESLANQINSSFPSNNNVPAGDQSLDSCNKSCQADGNCTDFAVITSPSGDQYCYLVFESKVIYFDQLNQTQCVEKCNNTSDCVALNHWTIRDVCVLFNQTDGIPPKSVSDDDTILKKGFCPYLL